MDWTTLYTALGTAAAAVGGFIAWAIRTEKKYAPLLQQLGANPHVKQAVTDAEAALAAKTSSERDAEIRAAVAQAVIAIKTPDPALTSLEQALLQSLVADAVPPAVRPYINVDTVGTALSAIAAYTPEAQANAWYKPVQDAVQAQTATAQTAAQTAAQTKTAATA
ncbi:MAG: hypothetical protein ACYCYO_01915 [Bacilli bacterium]